MPTAAPVNHHWIAFAILLGGGLTAAGFTLSARGAKHLGTLLYVTAILGTTIITSLRCYQQPPPPALSG